VTRFPDASAKPGPDPNMSNTAVLTIAVYQYAARDESPDARLERLAGAADHAAAQGARLLVTPEMFLCGYARPRDHVHAHAESADGPFARGVTDIARGRGLAIVYGYPEAADGVVYNAAQCIGPGGAPLANHRKLRLAGCDERETYTPGDGLTTFELDGHRIGLLICYDVEFPETVRRAALAGSTLAAVPTALVERHPFVARHMVPTRAFENGMYVAYANYAGREGDAHYLGASCVSGPGGGDAARADADETLLIASVDSAAVARARARIPYLEDVRGLPPGCANVP